MGFQGKVFGEPPPVRQEIGFPDGPINKLVKDDCIFCHNQNPPDTIPADPTYLPDRHHLKIGMMVGNPTAAPNPDEDPNGTYVCLSCHDLVWDEDSSSYVFDQNFRGNCTLCHDFTPHHRLDVDGPALRGNCQACHGAIVDNIGDSHYIPTYVPSLVTPKPSFTSADEDSTVEGSCTFCHNSGTTSDNIVVVKNIETHHGGGNMFSHIHCGWCHFTSGLFVIDRDRPDTIRRCENCHGVSSLHNIQADSNNDNAITPGEEDPYYGHIGAQEDCWGCHGFTAMAAGAPFSGPVVPVISDLSDVLFTAGVDTQLTLTGTAFTNTIQGPSGPLVLRSEGVIEDSLGNVITLITTAIEQNTIRVMMPATLLPGNYLLRAVKGDKKSNAMNISVLPAVVIASAACNGGMATVTGNGFSQYLEAAGSGTDLNMDFNVGKRKRKTTVTRDCSVQTWTDTQITADCGRCGDSILVDSIFGKDAERLPNPNTRR